MKAIFGTIQNDREWTAEDYKQWRLNQIGRGKRFEALRDEMAQRYTEANAVAVSYVNDMTASIYSLNRNYAAYTIDMATGGALTMPNGKLDGAWTLFDESTVRRLAKENPNLMPYYPKNKALRRGIDLAYGKKQITNTITSSILQGKSIKGIADELQTRISDMNRASAIRTARTACTEAQNAGKLNSFLAAEKMGIHYNKKWRCSFDMRTRHDHGQADGQVVPVTEPFIVGGEEMMYPADHSLGSSGWNIYNCRCGMVAVDPVMETEPRQYRVKNPETGRYELVNEMSYSHWLAMQNRKNSPGNMLINSPNQGIINTPIERNGAKGRPGAIDIIGADINNRQRRLLEALPEYDSRIIVKKNQVSMKDLAALTAHTGVEFAMFTKGGERLILRGSPNDCNIGEKEAIELRMQGYKWSGHTHPGNGDIDRMPSKGDTYILSCLRQVYSVIYDSRGMYTVFEGDGFE